jgi:hypothetical protein
MMGIGDATEALYGYGSDGLRSAHAETDSRLLSPSPKPPGLLTGKVTVRKNLVQAVKSKLRETDVRVLQTNTRYSF